jgi:hypothetical protein
MAKKPTKSRKPAKSGKAAKAKPVGARKPAKARAPARKSRVGAKPRKSPALLRSVKARVKALQVEHPGLGPDQLGQLLLNEFPELRPHLKDWMDLWPFMPNEK